MKTTIAERIAFTFVVAFALLTAGAWVYALAAEQHALLLMRTMYRQSTPELGAALAAGEADDARKAQLTGGGDIRSTQNRAEGDDVAADQIAKQ